MFDCIKVAVLRLYLRATGKCIQYVPDEHGVCRVCEWR